jgi:tetratricopeptide (TPR) repeat protein
MMAVLKGIAKGKAGKSTGLLLLLLAAVSCSAYAQEEGRGGTRSVFSLGAGSRGISMGGAFSAIADDPTALYYNPAALRLNRYPGVAANHIQLFSGFSDAAYDFIGFVYPTLSVGSIGLGLMTVGTGSIREFDRFSRETGEISYRESQAILGYAFDLPWDQFGKFTFGSSAKVLHQRVGDFSDTGTGFDAGLLYHLPMLKGLVLGCNLQDIIGAETKLVTESEKVDRTIMLGAGYSYLFANGSSLSLALQMDLPERDDREIKLGAEYNLKGMMSFRVGFDSEKITAGVGFMWRGFEIDYGYFSRDEAGSSHPISLAARLGQSLEERIRVRDERRLQEEERRVREIFAARVSDHLDTAARNREQGDLETALDELKIALEFDPANTAAAETLRVVRNEILRRQEERTKDAEKALLINQHFSLGLRYYSNNEYLLARAEWRNVIELDPENEQAKDYLERTEEKLTEQVGEHTNKANEFERKGQLTAALGEWSIVRMLDPELEEPDIASRRINERLERISQSYRATSQRLQDIRLFEEASADFGGGRYNEAAEKLRTLLGRQPNHDGARELLRRAERRMTPLTGEEKERIRQLYIAGMKHFTDNNFSAAIEQWRKILDIDPDNESVKKNIEEAETRLKKIDSSEGN